MLPQLPPSKAVRRTVLKKLLPAALFCLAVAAISCSSPRTDLRTVLPGDALVYLEARDLQDVVTALTESEAFRNSGASPVDSDVLEGISLAVAVTGFETSEQRLNEEASVLNFQPRFVAAAETHLWNFQALAFTEHSLGSFINNIYGGEVLLETSDRHDGKYFVWTAGDGRRAFAYVEGSLVFFGNDDTALDRALQAKRGEIEPIARNPKITDGDRLAFAYVSPDGLAQMSNIAAVSFAKNSADAPEAQGIVARILPELLRNSLREITWTATRSEQGIEDRYDVTMNPDLAAVFAETLAPAGRDTPAAEPPIPPGAASVTRYSLRDPRVAWRSVVLAAERAADPAAGALISAVASGIFEPYGIDDPEAYLAAAGPVLHTASFGPDGDRVLAIASVKDEAAVRSALPQELGLGRPPTTADAARLWRSEDGDIAAAFLNDLLITGDADSVAAAAASANTNDIPGPFAAQFNGSNAPAATVGTEFGTADKVVEAVTGTAPAAPLPPTHYFTETRFNTAGFERRTVSSFGLLGWIVSNFASEN